jgi:hypothetical protein
VLCLALSSIADRFAALHAVGPKVFAIWLVLTLVPYAMATRQDDELSILEQYAQFQVARMEIARAIDRAPDEWEILIPNRPYLLQSLGSRASDFPGLAGFFVMTYPSNVVEGRRVYFLAESEDVANHAETQRGSRISKLLVYRPGEGPQKPRRPMRRDQPVAGGM